MKICIAIPTNRSIRSRTLKALLELDVPYEKHIVVATEGYTTAENRNYIISQAQKAKCTHVLMVDDDMVFPPDTLTKLIESGKEVIGVNANSRMLPLKTTVEPLNDDPFPEAIFQVKAVGGGVLLIDMKVFEAIDQPWFDVETFDFGMTKMGEDSWFCRKATQAGFGIWCDNTIEIGHIGEYIF